jgi:glycosyltransferase involved in cell wall biosynthesis
LAKGKYIAFLDDDDEWLPTKLSEQVNIMNRSNENVGAVYAGFKWIFENGKTFEVLPRYEGHVFDNLLSKNCIGPTSTVLVKKKVLEEVGGFDEKLPLYQDWDLWLRIGKSYEFKYVPKILVNYYVHKNRSSKNSRAQLLAHVRFFNKYKNHLTSSELKASHYFLLGELLYLNANINSGRRYILASLFKCCKSPRQIFHNLNCIFHVTLSLSGPLTFSRLHSFLLNSRYPLIFRKYFDL